MSSGKCPEILIVGAGAVGVSMAYHLSLAGASIHFLVRPHRVAELNVPQNLYCYDDLSLKRFSEFEMVGEVAALAGRQFAFILLTLDGAQCRTAEGEALLRALGEQFGDSEAGLIICGVGVGLRQFIQDKTGFPDERLLTGTLGMLCHQVAGADLALHSPVDASQLQTARLAYRHFPDLVGFMLAAHPKSASRAFARLYNASGISRCRVMPTRIYNIITNAMFPFFAACELTGWTGSDAVFGNREVWSLASRAQREIIALPEHGWQGRLMAALMSAKRMEKLLRKLDRDSLPLDFTGFNRFHHGGKVRAQDVQVMENCLASGESQGRKMPALREILDRLAKYSPR